jgi:hypothetical protein
MPDPQDTPRAAVGRPVKTREVVLTIEPGRTCRCEVLVLDDRPKPVVVMIELASNDGVSVTNASEHLARAVAFWFLDQTVENLDLDAVTWVEHYPASARGRGLGESYDTVTYTRVGDSKRQPEFRPEWRHLGAAGFRELTGLVLDEFGRPPRPLRPGDEVIASLRGGTVEAAAVVHHVDVDIVFVLLVGDVPAGYVVGVPLPLHADRVRPVVSEADAKRRRELAPSQWPE